MAGPMLPAGYDFRKGRTWQKRRLEVLKRDRYICQYCGNRAVEVDHVRPVSRNGAWYEDQNLKASCRRCNRQRGNRLRGRPSTVFRTRNIDIPARTDNLSPRRGWEPIRGDYSRKRSEGGDGR